MTVEEGEQEEVKEEEEPLCVIIKIARNIMIKTKKNLYAAISSTVSDPQNLFATPFATRCKRQIPYKRPQAAAFPVRFVIVPTRHFRLIVACLH